MRVPDVDYFQRPNFERDVVISDIDDTLRRGLILQELCPLLNSKCQADVDLGEFNDHIEAYLQGDKPSAKLSLETCMRGLKDVRATKAASTALEYIDATRENLFNFTVPLFRKLGRIADIYLVTAEPEFVTSAFVWQMAAEDIAITGTQSVTFGQKGRTFSGQTSDITYSNKGALAQKLKETYTGSLAALGDHPNDLPMLETADQPIVVSISSDSTLSDHAKQLGWTIFE